MYENNLGKLVIKSNKSQKEIALDLGLSQQRFNNYIQCKRQLDYDLLVKLSKYFNVSTDYILNNEESTHNKILESQQELNQTEIKKNDTEYNLDEKDNFKRLLEIANLYFNDSKVSTDEKEKVKDNLLEMYWMAKNINKQ